MVRTGSTYADKTLFKDIMKGKNLKNQHWHSKSSVLYQTLNSGKENITYQFPLETALIKPDKILSRSLTIVLNS